ncbi:hypothetical protein FACS189479_05130 [Spirochaetia bacterium]|nr:hypothetical protein FACS189479_05130 [Spirochaetia bacterium]
MAITEKIKILMVKTGKKQKELATTLGVSPENFNNKLRRESFTPDELEKLAGAMGATYIPETFTYNGEEI